MVRQDVTVVTANPKTAGVARWNFLALWGHKAKEGDAACQDFVTKVPHWLAGGKFGHGSRMSRLAGDDLNLIPRDAGRASDSRLCYCGGKGQ